MGYVPRGFGDADIIKLEKILLAKKVGLFLGNTTKEHERIAVENVARILSKDSNTAVREVLAHELGSCTSVPEDIVERIVLDVAGVAGPFLRETSHFDDEGLSELISTLEDPVRAHIACRNDLGELSQKTIVDVGGELSVSSLMDNTKLRFSNTIYSTVVERFGTSVNVMDHMGLRTDLTKDIVSLISDKVSKKCKRNFYVQYGVEITPVETDQPSSEFQNLLARVKGASPAQVHACVADIRSQRNLTHTLVLEMAESDCLPFLESSLALMAGLPIGQVQDMMSLSNNKSFVKLMTMADVEKTLAPRYLQIAKKHYAAQKPLAA
ncbi:DUF2336 domain-containing protein [Kordiimonas sp. SCSIO 12610]|uniref:DUF2336 domain-containing protein n=1 Tax=Kordiimonas sp. SCSIO 12610 TaxID=2829597 RepID=UPI0021086524|nr:DUF2336 domain-containing protein [Kordiimonas sp. SCSIO 12610]UTW55016.1 DUF2336 domain-containing protein [Kordiimonas sp. SCSIO 12610]